MVQSMKTQRDLIQRAYLATCQGVEIDIMDMSKIFARGHDLLASGVDDAGLRDGIRDFVQTIRKN